jgi:hypothetical protein
MSALPSYSWKEAWAALERGGCNPNTSGHATCPVCRDRAFSFGEDDKGHVGFWCLGQACEQGTIERKLGLAPALDLDAMALKLTPELVMTKPPERKHLLWASDGYGVLVQGNVALLAARGGAGKSFALMSLGIAVALGSRWFGEGGWQAEQGRSLLLLAEEDAEEARRRLYWASQMAGADSQDCARIARDVTILPLAGQGVALTREDTDHSGGLPETAVPELIRRKLREAKRDGQPYRLVGLDPLARLAGGDVEVDNSAATRFCQVLETFSAPECGGPSVVVPHHTRKELSDGKPATNLADLIRGASGLVNGVRWAAVLSEAKPVEGAPSLLRLEVPKVNNVKRPAPLTLCRPTEFHGALRIATPEECEQYEAAAGKRVSGAVRSASQAELHEKMLEALGAKPYSANGLAKAIHVRPATVKRELNVLAESGKVHRVGGHTDGVWKVGPGGSHSGSGTRGGTGSGGSLLKGGGTGNHTDQDQDLADLDHPPEEAA